MSIKPQRSSFSLTNKRLTPQPIVSPLPPLKENQREENKTTLSNPDTSERTRRLVSQGLNPLRPVIVANTEFIPLSDGESITASDSGVDVGDNSIEKYRSIVSLFEIHRQIRLATLNSAENLLRNAKGFDLNEFLESVRKILQTELENLIRPTLAETVSATIQFISRLSVRDTNAGEFKASKIKQTKKDTNFAGTTVANNARSSVSQSFKNQKNNFVDEQKIGTILRQKSNDPFVRSLIEYAILDILVFDMIKYLSGLLKIKDSGLKTWSIFGEDDAVLSDLGTIGTLPSSVKKLQDVALPLPSWDGGYDEATRQSFSILNELKKLMNVSVSGNTPDLTLVIQTFLFGASETRLYGLTIGDASEPSTSIGEFPIFNSGGKSALNNALTRLSQTYVQSLVRDVYSYVSTFETAAERAAGSDPINQLNADTLNQMKGYFPDSSNLSDLDFFGNLLAGCHLNDLFSIAGFITSDKNKVFRSMGSQNSGEIQDIDTFYKKFLSIDNISSLTTTKYEYDLENPNSPVLKFLGLKDAGGGQKYLPLESTDNVSSGQYITGPEYFFDFALQRGDSTFKDFKDFASKYEKFATAYAETVYELTRPDYAVESFKKICEDVASDLFSGVSAFNLGLLIECAEDFEGLIKIFKSTYFASRTDSIGGVGDDDTDLSTEQGARRAMRYNNNSIITSFLVERLGIDSSKISKEARDAYRTLAGTSYTAIDNKEYVKKRKHFRTFYGEDLRGYPVKTFNKGTEYEETDYDWVEYEWYRRPESGGLTPEEERLERGVHYSTSLCSSLKNFIDNKHFVKSGLLTEDQVNIFNSRRSNDFQTLNSGRLNRSFDIQGSTFKLSDHHRLLILYGFIAYLLKRNVRFEIGNDNGQIEAYSLYTFFINNAEVSGIANALNDYSRGVNATLGLVPVARTWPVSKQLAYQDTYSALEKVGDLINKKCKNIAESALAPFYHARMLSSIQKRITSFVNTGDGSNRGKLSIDVLKHSKVKAFDSITGLLTRESVGQMYKSYINTLKKSEQYSFTKEDHFDLNKTKLITKILSNSNYGFLESERRGNKNVCNVGITNSLLNTLRFEAYKKTGDPNLLESTRFCVNVFKTSVIDTLMVYPKTFLFDSDLQVIDYDEKGSPLNHIKNFTDTWNFADIVNNIEFTEWSDYNRGDSETTRNDSQNFVDSFRSVKTLGSSLKRYLDEKILINHINDYALKEYYRLSTGLDLNEYNFSLEPIITPTGVVVGGVAGADATIQQDYDTLIDQLRQLYPAANVNQVLSSELFRNIKIISAHPAYALNDKLKRVLYPKKFDRVLSIFLNEKDFILYTPVYDLEFNDLFKVDPNFSYTSQICRYDFKDSIRGTNVKNKYKDQCAQSFPEIFNIYVTITILPRNTA